MINKVLIAALFASAAHAQAAPNPWAAMAKADLDFVYRTLKEDHPGAIDEQNPYFRQWMERGYIEASARARKAASIGDQKRLLSRYFAGFADGHLTVDFQYRHRRLNWPGVILARSGSRYMVTGRADKWTAPLPATGAALVSCDGRTPDTLMNEDVLPAKMNMTTLDSVKSSYLYYLFADDEEVPHQYAKCVFADAGVHKEFAMQWNSISRVDYLGLLNAARPSVGKHSSITQVGTGTVWIHLPQFSPGEAEEAELKLLPAQAARLRDAELVVFDLRGNGGGNSKWGNDVLDSFYGKAYMDYLEQKQGSREYAEYRVSAGNLRHAEHYIAVNTRQFGADASITKHAIEFARRMREALAKGAPFVRQVPEGAVPPVAPVAPAPLSKARAILVTHADCVSSCLDFADAVLRLPNVKHVGETTGADTLFMEVRTVALPSGLGEMTMAQKVYRGRQRGNNQPWTPSLHYDGQIGDTEKVKAWVLGTAR